MASKNNFVEDALNNNYVFAIVAILAYAYGQRVAPMLPDWLLKFFSHDIVKVLFLSLLLVMRFESRPTVAIIIAVTFIVLTQYICIKDARETFIKELSLDDSGHAFRERPGYANEIFFDDDGFIEDVDCHEFDIYREKPQPVEYDV